VAVVATCGWVDCRLQHVPQIWSRCFPSMARWGIAQCGGPVWVAAALLMWSIVIVLCTPLVSYLCFWDCNTYMNPICLILITTKVEQRTLNNEHTYISVWLIPVYFRGLNYMQNKYKTDGIRMSHTVVVWSFCFCRL